MCRGCSAAIGQQNSVSLSIDYWRTVSHSASKTPMREADRDSHLRLMHIPFLILRIHA
jgi:hypothetical protein